ncbi:hypothetical protein ALC57_15512 [Trachymyrmex cornetzi]|uniref:Uncharacterized protein n=1 Tax=Trachymyrmex cornetzi TaxID=471704 RepID=A0A151IWT7_9HYME|nr:hypothetical protein ALC57_15512 [Trachymyrmex cornetzi]
MCSSIAVSMNGQRQELVSLVTVNGEEAGFRPCRISVSSSCETFLAARSQPTLPAGRTCDGLKADGNYGGGSAAGIPSPDIPRDPMSPEIKVPSYWLKGVVKFTDTAVWWFRPRPLDVLEVPHGPDDTLLSV